MKHNDAGTNTEPPHLTDPTATTLHLLQCKVHIKYEVYLMYTNLLYRRLDRGSIHCRE